MGPWAGGQILGRAAQPVLLTLRARDSLFTLTSAIVQNLGNGLTRPCKAHLASKDPRSGDRLGFRG